MTQVAIVGVGLIGRAWAIAFARAGARVALWDAEANSAAAALVKIEQTLPEMRRHGLLTEEPGAVAARIHAVESLEAALESADHVQENAPERIEVKRELFQRLDAAASRQTVLASSTSALLPSAFSETLPGRERIVVAHPINPPHLIPAVEIVPAPWTSVATVERTAALMREIGQAPIVMAREVDGFVVNRLQGALLEEAFRLVEAGLARPEDIDIAVRDGLALRWSFMGPMETIDLNAPNGVRDYVERYGGAYRAMFPPGRAPANWDGPALDSIEKARRASLPASDLPQRAAWRDRRLMALLAHKRTARDALGD